MKILPSAWCVAGFLFFGCNTASASEACNVSLIQLIASPETFNGQNIRVIGFLHLEFEGDAVYLHREDFERSIVENSVAIDLSEASKHALRRLNNRYVIIEGRFSSVSKGHLSAHSGALQNITRLSDWSATRTSSRGANGAR